MVRFIALCEFVVIIFMCLSNWRQSAALLRRSTSLCMARGVARAISPNTYTGSQTQGVISPIRHVPFNIMRPNYVSDPSSGNFVMNPIDKLVIPVKTEEQIKKMRVAGRLAREILDEAVRFVRPGITTNDIDVLVHEETIMRNAYPSTLNYHGFPKSCCTSVNEVVCHGIPDSTELKSGDIINIDVTAFHDGVHGDCSETVLVGHVDDKVRDVVVTAYEAWQAAIRFCGPGKEYKSIGGIIEEIVSKKGYTTVKEFCGHGIGENFHELPNVLHYKNSHNQGIMQEGHVFTIEPMICMGKRTPLHAWSTVQKTAIRNALSQSANSDQFSEKIKSWTVTTSDGLPSAQFEHTILITKDGVEILTEKISTSPKYSWE